MKYLKTFESINNSEHLSKIEDFVIYYIRQQINIIGEIKKLRLLDFENWSYNYYRFFDDIVVGLGKYYNRTKGVLYAVDNFCKENDIPIYLDKHEGESIGMNNIWSKNSLEKHVNDILDKIYKDMYLEYKDELDKRLIYLFKRHLNKFIEIDKKYALTTAVRKYFEYLKNAKKYNL